MACHIQHRDSRDVHKDNQTHGCTFPQTHKHTPGTEVSGEQRQGRLHQPPHLPRGPNQSVNTRKMEAVIYLQPNRLPAAVLLREKEMDPPLRLHPQAKISHIIFPQPLCWRVFLFFILFIFYLFTASSLQLKYMFVFLLFLTAFFFSYFPFSLLVLQEQLNVFIFSAQRMINAPRQKWSFATVSPLCFIYSLSHLVAPIPPHVCQGWMKIRVMERHSDPDPASRSEPFVMATTPALSSKATRNWSQGGGACTWTCAQQRGLG